VSPPRCGRGGLAFPVLAEKQTTDLASRPLGPSFLVPERTGEAPPGPHQGERLRVPLGRGSPYPTAEVVAQRIERAMGVARAVGDAGERSPSLRPTPALPVWPTFRPRRNRRQGTLREGR
jgi:hypothetical protein